MNFSGILRSVGTDSIEDAMDAILHLHPELEELIATAIAQDEAAMRDEGRYRRAARRVEQQKHKERDRIRNSSYRRRLEMEKMENEGSDMPRVSARAHKGTSAYRYNKRDKRLMHNCSENLRHADARRDAMKEIVSPAAAQEELDAMRALSEYEQQAEDITNQAKELYRAAVFNAMSSVIGEMMPQIFQRANSILTNAHLAPASEENAYEIFESEDVPDGYCDANVDDIASEIFDLYHQAQQLEKLISAESESEAC